MIWVVALTHWLDDQGKPAPGLVGKHAEFCGRVVAAATVHPPSRPFLSGIGCTRRPGRQPCPGKLGVMRHPNGEVEWRCSTCDFQGFISSWQGTLWDLTDAPKAHGEHGSLCAFLSSEEYETLARVPTIHTDVRAAVAGAECTLDGIRVSGTAQAFTRLAEDIAHEAKRPGRKAAREVLMSIEARLLRALVEV
jgi:hypothetical protein